MVDVTEEAKEAYKKVILKYLKERIQNDENLREACKKPNKTLDGVIAYVIAEARKQQKNNVAVIPDDEVFNWVVHYIQEDEINYEPNTKVKAEPEEEQEEDEEEKPAPKKEPKKESKPKAAKKQVQKEEPGDLWKQLDLFEE